MNRTKQDRGWYVHRRSSDDALYLFFRVAPGKWKGRRVPGEAASTRPQAEKWARANVERLRQGEATTPKLEALAVVRVRDLEQPFLDFRAKLDLRPATKKQDASVMSVHVVPLLGALPATDAELHVGRLLDFVGRLRDQGLEVSTIRNVLSVLRCFFDVVKAKKLAPGLTTNPCRDPEFVRLGVPKNRKRTPKALLTIEVAEQLLTHDQLPEHWKVRILIGCTGGLRDGEIAGLQWQDLELDARIPVMHISQAVALVGEKGGAELGPTKTPGSVRDVPIHPEAAKALKAWKAAGWVEWVGRRPKPHDFVLPSEQGTEWRPRSAELLRGFLVAAAGEGADRHADRPIDFHALRRSFATWLARAGVERAIRKRLIGHVEADVDEEHYIERDLPMLYEAVCRIRLDLSKRGATVIRFPAGRARADK